EEAETASLGTKTFFIAEAKSWIEATKPHRSSIAIGRRELRGIDRLNAYRRAHVEGLARYYRANAQADVAPGLFAVIIELSDNDVYGACFLPVPRLAQLLGSEPNTSRRALRRLVDAGLIGMQERPQSSTLYWPLVPGCFVGHVSVHWLIELYSPPARSRGRPRKAPLVLGEGFSEKTPPC